MKLLTKKIIDRFEKVGKQEHVKNPLVIAKFFNPAGSGTWLLTEYNPETKVFFCVANIFDTEWGYTSLIELENFKGRFGLGIERDIFFDEKPMSEALTENGLTL